jgi:serine/threonine protein kinase
VQIGRFQVLGEIGRGAMGVVYRALDPKIGRTLAIKSIRLNELTDPQERSRMRERLFREAQSAGILSHPNIVTIYDVSEEDGLAYIFMEFVNGMPLDEMLRTTEFSGQQLMDLMQQTASALDFAHSKGIIHRDIKPANIMVHEGRVAKVCDFGVAKIVSQQMTQAGLLMGTPSYMAPEQIEGKVMDGRSDQFALAIMIFDILTGEKPFTGESLPILLYKICRAEPPSASALNTTLGIWVDPVLHKALSKNPADRYPTCEAFVAELTRALNERPEWTLAGKGFPGEESTTGSGHDLPARPAAAAEANIPTDPGRPVPLPAAGTQAASQPTPVPVPVPVPPLPAATAGPLPVRKGPPPRSFNPALFLVPVILIAGCLGYIAYQKFAPAKGALPIAESAASVPEEKSPEPMQPEVKPPPLEPPAEKIEAPPAKAEAQPAKTEPPSTTPENKPPAPPAKPVARAAPPATEITAGTVDEHRPVDPGLYLTSFTGTAGAHIIVDGAPAKSCRVPCSIPLPKGRHTIHANLEGFQPFVRFVEVTAENTVPVEMEDARGFLVIDTKPPGAGILINGVERTEKTPASMRLKAGTYEIVLVNKDGRRNASSVTIKEGSVVRLNGEFP